MNDAKDGSIGWLVGPACMYHRWRGMNRTQLGCNGSQQGENGSQEVKTGHVGPSIVNERSKRVTLG
jgi:hypothetical protein